jgi:phosphoserine phosphatase
MLMAGPWPTLDAVGDLGRCLRAYNLQHRNNPVRWDHWVQARAAFEEQRRQQRAEEYARELAAGQREQIAHTLRTATTTAEVLRALVARHVANGAQLSAAEDWG